MQAGFNFVARSGLIHLSGLTGGLNRSGGESAKGMPRYLWITAVAEGRVVEVPMMIPESILAVGEPSSI
jgi:hypothetical protein